MAAPNPPPSRLRCLNLLASADALIDRDAFRGRLTLAPQREQARSLGALFEALVPDEHPSAWLFAQGLSRCARAQLRAFPENLFWDFDALAGSLWATLSQEREVAFGEATALIASLQPLYGSGSPIRFRYVHDFVYGYDWSKWVRRDSSRSAETPFGLPFLRYSWRRGHELLALIAQDDKKYPKLRDGLPRNPFAFSREPDDEIRLFRRLAVEGSIPLKAWELDPKLVPDVDYYALRRVAAES